MPGPVAREVVSAALLGPAHPASAAETMATAEESAAAQAVVGELEGRLSATPLLAVTTAVRSGDRRLLLAGEEGPDGAPSPHEGTPLAERAEEGLASSDVAALPRWRDGRGRS